MSFRALLVFSTVILLVPFALVHAGIIPVAPESGYRLCDLVTLVNNVIKFVIQMSALLAVMLLVIVGFKSIVSGESGAHELKSTLTNIVVGIIIMLLAWTVVDTILKVLTGGTWGPWNTVTCIDNPTPQTINTGAVGTGGTGNGTFVTGGGTGSGAQCATGNTACSVDALKAAGMTDAQANAMSCIAMTESSGNPGSVNTSGGACGTFQLLPSNWRNPRLHSGSCSSGTSCTDAACNAQAAKGLMDGRAASGRSVYGDWTCNGCNAKAQACVARYDPGH